jgi:3D (Asp-Asp-Asp) domain-containing protein
MMAASVAVLPGTAAAASSGAQTYTVQRGDTFWLIARKYGISADKLMASNAGIRPYNLQIGTRISVPVGSASTARNFVASAYSAHPDENGGAQWAGLDYFGNRLVHGKTIAVDPNVIPLGSTVWVSGYNWSWLPANGFAAQATDVGSAIKGNRIDIYLDGAQRSVAGFGLQNVKVTVLN